MNLNIEWRPQFPCFTPYSDLVLLSLSHNCNSWEQISEKMKKYGFYFSPQKCELRFVNQLKTILHQIKKSRLFTNSLYDYLEAYKKWNLQKFQKLNVQKKQKIKIDSSFIVKEELIKLKK